MGSHGRDRMVVTFTPTCAISQSVPITTKDMSLNLAQAMCSRYNIM